MRPKALALAVLALLGLAQSASATSFVLQPGPIDLGTTEQHTTVQLTGGEALGTVLPNLVTPDFVLTLDAGVTLGSAIILNPDETTLLNVQARLTASPVTSVLVGTTLQFTLTDLVLTLEGGTMSAIGLPPAGSRDFAVDPVSVALPTTVVSVDVLQLFTETASLTLPIDARIPIPGYPSVGSASLVVAGDFVFTQVPEPRTSLALAASGAGLLARWRRRAARTSAAT